MSLGGSGLHNLPNRSIHLSIHLLICSFNHVSSTSTHLFIYLPVHPPTRLSIYSPVHPSTHPFIHPPVHPSTHLSIHPPVHPPTHLFIHLPIRSSHPPISPSTYLLIHPPSSPSTHLFIHPSCVVGCMLGVGPGVGGWGCLLGFVWR